MIKRLIIILLNIFIVSNVFATEHVIDLVVGYKDVEFAKKDRKAIAVNNQIPAPTLHFKEGDTVTINVYNELDEETAIHWHGLLVPWQMDGVLGVTQHGIQPGEMFQYHFTLEQAGTYWYHAHAGLQEQQGLYGAFIIDPQESASYEYTKDYVVVLSDWSNTHPNSVLKNLKKAGDYYSPRFPMQPSLMRFVKDYSKADADEKKNLINDYKMMQQMRMSIYDLSDIAYDAFLLNGQPNDSPWTAPVTQGDIVRLRFIGAVGSSILRVKIPETPLKIIHVQGNDVIPYEVNDFTIASGETYDVLMEIKEDQPYIIYAQSNDKVGAAYGALLTQANQAVNYAAVAPFPDPMPVTREMMHNMMTSMGSHPMNMQTHSMPMHQNPSPAQMSNPMDMNAHMTMNQPMKKVPAATVPTNTMPVDHQMNAIKPNHAMQMPTEPSILGDQLLPAHQDVLNIQTRGTKYQNLLAAVPTNDTSIPVEDIIKMELFGYMEHFIWFINGVPAYNAPPIVLDPAKRYRIIFTNNSMMHHPMHIHGHWFIFRNGHGEYDPLLHTIDVAPGATVVADIDTDASGQWFFHCHFLYHMETGMSRVFQYSSLIEITQADLEPQNIIEKTDYYNRPIVRVDEVRPIETDLVRHPMAHPKGLYLSSFVDVGADPFNNIQRLNYKGLYGPDYNKLELFINDAELNEGIVENADIDIFYWRLISQFWAIKGGANYFYRPAQSPYWQPGVGIEGLAPYFIDVDARLYFYQQSAKLDLELSRDTQITNNFFLRAGVRSILASKAVQEAEIGHGLNQMRYLIRPFYRLMPGLDVFMEFEHEQSYGQTSDFFETAHEDTIVNSLTFGLSVLF